MVCSQWLDRFWELGPCKFYHPASSGFRYCKFVEVPLQGGFLVLRTFVILRHVPTHHWLQPGTVQSLSSFPRASMGRMVGWTPGRRSSASPDCRATARGGDRGGQCRRQSYGIYTWSVSGMAVIEQLNTQTVVAQGVLFGVFEKTSISLGWVWGSNYRSLAYLYI